MENTHKTLYDHPLVRQFLGAAAGVFIAVVAYNTYGYVADYVQVTPALLVNQESGITENADKVRVNNKNVDDETLRRLTSRAKQVAAQYEANLGQAASAPLTELQANAIARAKQREYVKKYSVLTATTYDATTEPATQRERIAARTAQVATAQSQPATEANVRVGPVDVAMEATHAAADTLHSGAELPTSGIGTYALAITALGFALFVYRKRIAA